MLYSHWSECLWYGSLYHATCLTSICISKANANSVKDQTEMPATFKNINRILGHKKKLNQLHVLVTGHSLSLLQRLYPLNVHSCKRCLFEGKVYLTCVYGSRLFNEDISTWIKWYDSYFPWTDLFFRWWFI